MADPTPNTIPIFPGSVYTKNIVINNNNDTTSEFTIIDTNSQFGSRIDAIVVSNLDTTNDITADIFMKDKSSNIKTKIGSIVFTHDSTLNIIPTLSFVSQTDGSLFIAAGYSVVMSITIGGNGTSPLHFTIMGGNF